MRTWSVFQYPVTYVYLYVCIICIPIILNIANINAEAGQGSSKGGSAVTIGKQCIKSRFVKRLHVCNN